jgi:hypothetical protein
MTYYVTRKGHSLRMLGDELLFVADRPLAERRRPLPGELLFEFDRGETRIRCELRDHGVYGVEAQLLYNGELMIGRTLHQRLDPSRTPRQMAIAWAEAERVER